MPSSKAIVEFDYEPVADDELSLKVGDVITDIVPVEEGWCRGKLNGVSGMFPDNFVKMISEDKPPPAVPPMKPKKEPKRVVKVTFAYAPANEDELELKIGDIVEVLTDEEEGWARGVLNGHEGVFPTNFTEPMKLVKTSSAVVKPESETPLQPLSPPPAEPVVIAAPKKIKGVGFGDIFNDKPIKLRNSATPKTPEPENKTKNEKRLSSSKMDVKSSPSPVAMAPPTPTSPSPSSLVPKSSELGVKDKNSGGGASNSGERYVVAFEYDALNEDELSLRKGQTVWVDDMNLPDAGWWAAHLVDADGSVHHGVVPDNFLVPAPLEDIKDTPSLPPPVMDNKAAKAKIDQVLDIRPTSGPTAKSNAVINPSALSSNVTSSPDGSMTRGSSASMKRQAPKAPAPSATTTTTPQKPATESGSESLLTRKPSASSTAADSTPALTAAKEEEVDSAAKLTHFKRAAGPKNRKKPDAGNRRSKANEASAAAEIAMTSAPVTSLTDAINQPATAEPAAPEPAPNPPQPVSAKRDHKRGGVQVMPGLGAALSGGAGGDEAPEKPSWMKNLKSRKSGKGPTPPVVSHAPHEPTEAPKPSWLANLKKTKPGALKPAVPTAKPFASSLYTPDHDKPDTPSARLEPEPFKLTQHDNGDEGESGGGTPPTTTTSSTGAKVAARQHELKKSAHLSQQQPRPVSMILPTTNNKFGGVDFGAKKSSTINKPRPPPPTSKPTLGGAAGVGVKPVATSNPNLTATATNDDVKEEVKVLKELFTKLQAQFTETTGRLQNEIDVERKKRRDLEAEIDKLKKRVK